MVPTEAPPAEPVDIRLRTFLDIQGETPREQTLAWLVEQYQEENPNVNVVVETIPYDQLNAKLIIENEGGTAPEVSYVQPQGIGKLAVSNSLLPLDPFIARWSQEKLDEFYAKELWNSTVVDGDKLTMAIGIHTRCLYTNREILEAAGLDPQSYPSTLAEVVEMGTPMTGGDVYGMGMCFGPERATAEIFIYPMIWGYGGKALDEEGNPIFNNEIGVQAFDWCKDLVLTHKITPEDSLAMTYSELSQQFPEGRYGMVLEGSYRLSGWLAQGMSWENMGAAPWPSIEAGQPSPMFTNSWDLAIASNTPPEKQDAAWGLVAYYFEPEVSKRYTLAEGSLPTLQSLLNEEEFQTPYHEVYAEVIAAGGRGLPQTPWVEELDDLLISALHDIMINNTPTQEALDKAAEEYAKIAA
jgi:multiple sugar transport system substrate-binding protein